MLLNIWVEHSITKVRNSYFFVSKAPITSPQPGREHSPFQPKSAENEEFFLLETTNFTPIRNKKSRFLNFGLQDVNFAPPQPHEFYKLGVPICKMYFIIANENIAEILLHGMTEFLQCSIRCLRAYSFIPLVIVFGVNQHLLYCLVEGFQTRYNLDFLENII